MRIEVGEQPTGRKNRFIGTSDIAFGPHGRLFITDGYGNARVLEYTSDGKRVGNGEPRGTAPANSACPTGSPSIGTTSSV